jgi:hypothetical protein
MTVVPDNTTPATERCEGCVHFDNWGDSPLIDLKTNSFGECICPYSDHYGHVISFGHPACEKKEV